MTARAAIRVLVVDEDEGVHQRIRQLLEGSGGGRVGRVSRPVMYETARARDVASAQTAQEAGGYDVCLIRERLAKADGGWFLKEAAEGRFAPCILLCERGAEGGEESGTTAGAVERLSLTDLSADSLERAIRYSLDRAEILAALRRSQRRCRELAEVAGAIPFEVELPDWRVAYIGPEAAGLFGYPLDQWHAPGFWRLRVHADDRARVESRHASSLAGECEYRMTCGDGRVVWVHERLAAPGEPPNTRRGFLFDVTERKRAELALAESERRYRLLADNATDLIWTTDLGLRFTFLSPSVVRTHGYLPEELLGRSPDLTLTPRSYREVVRLFSEEVARENRGEGDPQHTFTLALEERRKDGSTFWSEMHARFLYDAEGRAVGILGATRDITERKRGEEEERRLLSRIQEAQHMESLGLMAGGIAHDFNNLLMGVLGNAGLLRAELPPDHPGLGCLEQIEEAAQRAADLTSQMLAYSGRGKYVVTAIDLSDLVGEMARLLSAVISKQAVPRLDLAPDLPAIEGDPAQIRQAILNLATNASEAVEEAGGVVTVSTGVLEVDRAFLSTAIGAEDLGEGTCVFLRVTDTGGGMSSDVLAHIFAPFFSTKFTGRGLGLAAVLGIVRGHGGAIRVESHPGQGSSFLVVFPIRARQELRETAAAGRGAEWRGSGAILVVDDEESVRTVARLMLERFGFNVFLAADGRAAVELFHQHAERIRAVLLDASLPGPSGVEVFRRLRDLRPETPVILSSGYTQEVARERFPEPGLAGFIQKPYRPADLIDMLRRLL